MYKLSVTGDIGLFLQCKRCFYLSVVKNIKRPDSIFPSLPSGMDRILKDHFDNFMLKGQLPPEIAEHEHLNGLKLFDDLKLLDEWRNYRKGLTFTDPNSGCVLKGALDNVLKSGSKLIVLDYKTRGYPLKSDTHEHYQNQMDFYNFLLRKNGFDTEDFTFLLFYYPNRVNYTGEVVFDTKLIKIETNPDSAEKIFYAAIACLKGPMPPKDESCEFCNYNSKEMHLKLLDV